MDPGALDEALRSIREPSPLWTELFMVCSYAMAAGCVYRGIREGARRADTLSRWKFASGQVLVFALLTGLFWFVESWANHRTPFYLYSTQFTDLVPRLDLAAWGIPRGVDTPCTKLVLDIADKLGANKIPLCVLLLEASLTYTAMWTARLLGANLIVQPLLAGLVLVNVDALLDPVVATTHACSGAPERPGIGLGFWRWYVEPGVADWFGVPIFNYAAWFAAPVFLICLVNLLGRFSGGWFMPLIRKRSTARDYTPVWWEGASLLLMIVMIAFMFRIAPSTSNFLSPTQQQIAMVLLLAGAAVLVFEFTRPSDGSAHRVEDATLTRPTAIALVIPTIALVSEGFFVTVPKLIYVAIFTTVLGFLFVWVPYPKALRSFCKRLVLLDRFVRLHYFGFTSMLILLGAAAVSPVTDPAAASTNSGPDKFLVGGLLLVGLCFHIYSYVLNDVIDLDLDRTQRRRRLDPLVRGFVSREVALAFALLQFPLAFLLTLHLVHFQLIANTPAFTALGVGFLLILVYNLWGKVCPFPPFTDLIQGLGWGSLVLVGALVADKHTDLNQLLDRTGPLLAYATGFILLINGVHGGLRDLWTDKEQKKITTALFFGADRSCGEARDQPVRTTVKLRVFAFVVHTLMFSSIFYFLLRDPERSLRLFDPTEYRWAWGVTMVLFVVSNCMLWQVVKHLQPNRDFWSSMHVFVVLLAPLFLYVISWKPHDVFKVMVLSTFFVPLALQEDLMKQAMRWLYGGRSRGARPAAGPPPQPQAAA